MPLNELPRRIAYQASTSCFGVLTMSPTVDVTYVRVLSQTTWEEVASLQLDQDEVGCCIASVEHPTQDGEEVRLTFNLNTESP